MAELAIKGLNSSKVDEESSTSIKAWQSWTPPTPDSAKKKGSSPGRVERKSTIVVHSPPTMAALPSCQEWKQILQGTCSRAECISNTSQYYLIRIKKPNLLGQILPDVPATLKILHIWPENFGPDHERFNRVEDDGLSKFVCNSIKTQDLPIVALFGPPLKQPELGLPQMVLSSALYRQ
jgi:hypothetical protein